jgi:SAM-dependent methyltransferase
MPYPPWFHSAFKADYLRVYPHRDVDAGREEVAFLLDFGLPRAAGVVLDLACGYGRHSQALAEAGLRPLGLDLSPDLLARGTQRLGGRLVRADMLELPLQSDSVDASICLFSSLGYFPRPEQNQAVLAGLARVLRPGAPLFLDLMNPGLIRRTLVPESRSERDGVQILERRRLGDGGLRVLKQVQLTFEDGTSRTWTEDVRMFEPPEIRAALELCGFRVEATRGDFSGSLFTSESPRQLVRARRT